MYKLHLILKYLRKRRIAWVSLIAVMLCTTMVLVVISVMGGWLRMFTESFQGLSGEVIVSARHPAGFPYYEQMSDRIGRIPGVKPDGVVPVIRTFGLINIGNLKGDAVQVIGYPLDRIGKVNAFPESLWRQHKRFTDALERGALTETERYALGLKQREDDRWPRFVPQAVEGEPLTPLTEQERQFLRERAAEGMANPDYSLPYPNPVYEAAIRFANPRAPDAFVQSASRWPGMIAGIGVVEIRRDREGNLIGRSDDLYQIPTKLTVLGLDPGGSVDISNKTERPYWIVDDSQTGVWQYDSNAVYVPFDIIQQDLSMQGIPDATDRDGNPSPVPPRTTELHIGVIPGNDLEAIRDQVRQIVDGVFAEQGVLTSAPPRVETWRDTQATFINAIENEKLLVTILFCIISMVAVFLIFCIFYMIVVEKTKDIGIIKSVGASSEGVAGIFLGYGLAIGLVGAGMGLLLAWLIVSNINELHTWMGRLLNVQIWNPEVYAFDTIPNTMDPFEVTVIMAIAVVSSVLGSLIPAIRAASMEPIEALRYE